MIDWGYLVVHALWILGSALALATLSYASWQASLLDEKLSVLLSWPGYQKSLCRAGMLFCAGLSGASAPSTIQAVLWSILGSICLIQLIFLVYGEAPASE